MKKLTVLTMFLVFAFALTAGAADISICDDKNITVISAGSGAWSGAWTETSNAIQYTGGVAINATPDPANYSLIVQGATEFRNKDGNTMLTIGADSHTISIDGVTVASVASSGAISLTKGTNADPSINFIDDTDTGIRLSAVGRMQFVIGGGDGYYVNDLAIYGAANSRSGYLAAATASSTVPNHSFADDTNSGMGATANDWVTLIANATAISSYSSTGTVTFHQYGAGAASFDALGNVVTASDEIIKNIKRPMTGTLSEVCRLQGQVWTWKPESGYETTQETFGLTAQGVDAVWPELVSKTRIKVTEVPITVDAKGNVTKVDRVKSEVPAERWSIKPGIEGKFIEAFKEVKTRLEAAEKKNAAQDVIIADLLVRVKALEAK